MEYWIETVPVDSFVHSTRVEAEGFELALFKDNGEVYCLNDICSHEYSRLSEGEVYDGEVYCVKHGSRFNLKTGDVTGFPATRPVETYETKVVDGLIHVKLVM